MSSSGMFTGPGFTLYSASSLVAGVIRVTFTQVPQQSNPAGANDATNKSLWSITGPSGAVLSSVDVVVADPLSVDLVFAAPLAYGTWTITASASIQTPTLAGLTAPLSVSVDIAATGTISALNPGGSNDTAEQILRKHLNPTLAGPTWDVVIAAIASGDNANWQLAQNIFDQLFKTTASGKYLDILAAGEGLKNPIDVGLSENNFRQLAIHNPYKVTYQSILDILEVYFGAESLRAFHTTTLAQPYNIVDGSTLTVTIDETFPVEISFSNSQFRTPSQATAVELAAAITQGMALAGSEAFAVAWLDPVTANTYTRLYSPSKGLKSFVRVTGGTAQPYIQFPTYLNVYNGFTSATWVATTTSDNKTVLTRTTADHTIDIAIVQASDYVVFGPNSGTLLNTTAIVDSVAVSGNYTQVLTLTTNLGLSGSYSQTATTGLSFFRPTKAFVRNDSTGVVVSQTAANVLDVSLPATSRNVSRVTGTAAYGQAGSSIGITKITRLPTGVTSVTTATAHGLTTGDRVDIDSFLPSQSMPWVSSKGGWVRYPTAGVASSNYVTQFPISVALENGTVCQFGGTQIVTTTPTKVAVGNRWTFASSTVSDGSDANGVAYYADTVTAIPAGGRHTDFAGTALTGGWATKVWLSGGRDAAGTSLSTTQTYDSATNTYATGPILDATRACHAQVLLSDGRVLVVGGAVGSGSDQIALIYNPTFDSLSYGTALLTGNRQYLGAARLPDNKVLIIGGRGATTATNTCEIWDPAGSISPAVGMSHARSLFATVTLDDGRILVIGGEGYEPCRAAALTALPLTAASTFTAALSACEIYDQNTQQWSRISSMAYTRVRPWAVKLAGGKILVGSLGAPSEVLSTDTMTWSTVAWSNPTANERAMDFNWATVSTNGTVVGGGGTDSATTSFLQPLLIQPAGDVASAGGINGNFAVTVTSSTTFTFQSDVSSYTSSHGAGTGTARAVSAGTISLIPSESDWRITNASRTGGFTTVTVSAPVNYSGTYPFSVGQTITVNTGSATYASGTVIITAIGTNTVTYAEAGGVSAGAIAGTITFKSGTPTEVSTKALSSALAGPYVFDPTGAVTIAPGYTTLASQLSKGQAYRRITVAATSAIPDTSGWVVLAFGATGQSEAIKYLETLPNGANLDLLVENYIPTVDWATGTTVTPLLNRTPSQPPADASAFYVTGSSSGRVAAEAHVRSSAAAGIDINVNVLYPGDRGLGGEGQPVSGIKTSDKIIVWGSDEMDDLR